MGPMLPSGHASGAGVPACLVAVVLAGCGGGGAKSNGIVDMTPKQILTEMQKAIANAKSVHISGSGTTGGTHLTLDLQLARGQGRCRPRRDRRIRVRHRADRPEAVFPGKCQGALEHYAGATVATAARRAVVRGLDARRADSARSRRSPTSKQLMKQILTASGPVEKGEETKIGDQPRGADRHGERRHALCGHHRARVPARAEARRLEDRVDHVHRLGPAGDAHRAEGLARLREADRRLTP